MTDQTTTLPSTLFRGFFIPVADWTPPLIEGALFTKAKAKLAEGDAKALTKYAGNVAIAMGLDEYLDEVEVTKDGKPIKPHDLFLAILEGQVEAEAAAAKRKAEAEAAAAALREKMAKVANLEKEMKEEVTKNPALPFSVVMGWANLAASVGATLVIKGGEGEDAGPKLRMKSEGGGTTRAPRETGGGSKGGTETRVSAYAEALRFQKKGNAPHDITRTGDSRETFAFFDHGKPINGPLSKYLQNTYPTSPCALSLKGYDERRKAAKGAST